MSGFIYNLWLQLTVYVRSVRACVSVHACIYYGPSLEHREQNPEKSLPKLYTCVCVCVCVCVLVRPCVCACVCVCCCSSPHTCTSIQSDKWPCFVPIEPKRHHVIEFTIYIFIQLLPLQNPAFSSFVHAPESHISYLPPSRHHSPDIRIDPSILGAPHYRPICTQKRHPNGSAPNRETIATSGSPTGQKGVHVRILIGNGRHQD